MAHLMESNDVQIGLSMAWHNLTKIVDKITEGFSFEYEKTPLFANGQQIPGWYFLTGSDDKAFIGKPQNAESYTVIPNSRFFELVKDALNGTGAEIQSLGTFSGRAKRYATVKIGADWEKFSVGKREFQNYLNIQDAVDGSLPLIAKGSNTCIVCNNTFNMSLSEKSEFRLSLRHTKFMADKLEGFEHAIDAYAGTAALFKRLLESADTLEVSEGKAKRVFLGFLTGGDAASTRAINQANRMTELFKTGKGNEGHTALDVISAVTDYYSHESSGGLDKPWRQFNSSEIGAGAKDKSDFISSVRTTKFEISSTAIRDLAKMGETALTASDSVDAANFSASLSN